MTATRRGDKPRVLALVTDAFGGHGGIAQFNRDFLSALAASPHVGRILALPRAGVASAADLPMNLVQAPPSEARVGYAVRALSMGLARFAADVVFCGHLYMAPLAALIARLSNAPLWLQLHGVEAWDAPTAIVGNAVRHARLTTAVSRFTRERFLAWADVNPERVRVLPNTVDRRFTPGPKPEHLAKKLDVVGRRVLLTVSRLASSERYKGHDRVIAALPAVLALYPDALYLIAGDGDDRPRLERLAEEAGLAASVRFLGRVSGDDLVELYRLADVFVMPSSGEGFGIVFLEAAACGAPVIGGDRDGGRDALADGAVGAPVNLDDPGALPAAICAALAGQERPDPAAVARFTVGAFNAHVGALLASLAPPATTYSTAHPP